MTVNNLITRENMFLDILQNPDIENDFFEGLEKSCSEFLAIVITKCQNSATTATEFNKREKELDNLINAFQKEKKDLKHQTENNKLIKKTKDKKLHNLVEEITNIKEEIDKLKKHKEELNLMLIDLEKESENCKKELIKSHCAFKRAMLPYKNYVDIHINTDMGSPAESVTVTFFYSENPTDYKFFVTITLQDNYWKISQIEPDLSMDDKCQLNSQLQKKWQASNAVIKVLCELRKLFLKKYF